MMNLIYIKKMKKKFIFVFILLLIMDLFGVFIPGINVKAKSFDKPKEKVLIINSYNGNEKWGKDIITGLRQFSLRGYYLTPMDLMHRAMEDSNYMEHLEILVDMNREIKEVDGIITVGEPAKDFWIKYGEALFGDIPVVNTGVKYDGSGLKPNQYIINCDYRIDEMIEEIFKIHGDLDKLVIVEDKNPGYDWKSGEYDELPEVYKKKIKFIKGDSSDEIIDKIDDIEGEIAVLMTPIATFMGKSNEEYKMLPKNIETKKKIPVYSFWNAINGYNIVGGLYYQGHKEGNLAGAVLKSLWAGETPDSHLVENDGVSEWQFNYDFVKKYNIQSDKMNDENLKGVPKKKSPLIWIVTTIASIIIFVLLNFLYFNITKRRAAEESYEKNKEELTQVKENSKVKTDFFANITHDIRTPIGVIQSITQLLKVFDHNKADTGAKVDSYYKTINDNCNRLLRMTSNLIDMTKIEAGFMELEKKNFEMVGLVENLVLSISELCNKKDIDVIFDTEVEEVVMNCDGYKIERVVMNLLSNAVKFTPPNGEIEVFMSRSDSQLNISVKDSGIGMPESKLNSIFNKFDMGDGNQEMNSFGCGIGLYIVKSIVEKHNGGIDVMSTVGEGTEFLIKIPIVETQEEEIVYTYLNDNYGSKIEIEFSEISG